MNSPYKYHLEDLRDQEVTIHRANASELTGVVTDIQDAGCIIKQPADVEQGCAFVFIAYEDIRGIARTVWDVEKL